MIAITIGLILLGGIGYVYLGSRQTFRTQDDFSRIQENVRYALDQVGVDVRMAGYSGCVNLSAIDPKADSDSRQRDCEWRTDGWHWLKDARL